MTRVIYKFELNTTVTITPILLQRNYRILHIQEQNNVPCIWVEVDLNEQPECIFITAYGTGQSLSDNRGDYIGTLLLYHGALVLHYYDSKTTVPNNGN